MLLIEHPARNVPKREYFDNRTQEFITIGEQRIPPIRLQLEHSLKSIARWEAKWHRSFIGRENLSGEELLDYVKCMTINRQEDPKIYDYLTQEDVLRIIDYMQDQQSAWEISSKKKTKKGKKGGTDTSESIYYAMIQFGVPMECENWHFNRLMALLDYCDCKGGSVSGAGGPAKRSQKEIMEMYRAMNEKNRKKYNSRG